MSSPTRRGTADALLQNVKWQQLRIFVFTPHAVLRKGKYSDCRGEKLLVECFLAKFWVAFSSARQYPYISAISVAKAAALCKLNNHTRNIANLT